ncbi:MAG TPA: hypothetical protein VFW62_07590, partial [bacterium]|nr:hypothetical protein [bacterium]
LELSGAAQFAKKSNEAFLVERLFLLPQEERIGLANRLIDELGKRGPQAEQAANLLGGLTRMILPNAVLRRRLSQLQNSQNPDAREIAIHILHRWESLN